MVISGFKLSVCGILGSIAVSAAFTGFAVFHDYRRQNSHIDRVVSIYDINNTNGLESFEANELMGDLIRKGEIGNLVNFETSSTNVEVKFAGYNWNGSDRETYFVAGGGTLEIFLGRPSIEYILEHRFD